MEPLIINLLPWREQQQQRKQRRFLFFWLFSLSIILVMMAIIHQIMATKIATTIDLNRSLQQEIAQWDSAQGPLPKLELQQVPTQQSLAQQKLLQQQQTILWQFFTALAQITPNQISLTQLKYETSQLLLTGYATSNAALAHFYKNLELLPGIKSCHLLEAAKTDAKENHFKILVTL